MDWNNNNPYYSPLKCGLEIVAEVEYSDRDQYDIRVVWRDLETGRYYTARDSGCSLLDPFEEYHSLSDLQDFDYATLRDEGHHEVKGDGSFGKYLSAAVRNMLRVICRCGHNRYAHRHYRHGSDCGRCNCPQFRFSLIRSVHQYLRSK